MGARRSPESLKAETLIKKHGYTQYAAAQATGLSRSSISKAAWYRDWVAEQEAIALRAAKRRKAAK